MPSVRTQPEPLEVRRSRVKLILYSSLFLPVLPFAPAIAVWAASELAAGRGMETFAESWFFPLVAATISAAIWRYLWRLWKALAMDDVFLRLTPAGLVMPSLDSEMPIPWENVDAGVPSRKGKTFGIVFKLKVDPRLHTKILGATPMFRLPGRANRAVVKVPRVFNVSRGQILRRIEQYKAFAAETAARHERPATAPPMRMPATTRATSWVRLAALLLLGPLLLFNLGLFENEPTIMYGAAIVFVADIGFVLWLRGRSHRAQIEDGNQA